MPARVALDFASSASGSLLTARGDLASALDMRMLMMLRLLLGPLGLWSQILDRLHLTATSGSSARSITVLLLGFPWPTLQTQRVLSD